jgi:hypothetical protein
MQKRGNRLIIILISIIFLLLIILGYGVYTGFKVKAEITKLTTERDNLQEKYDLLIDDVREIYKTCRDGNACLGHYPGVSWYCNNVGDEVDDYSHICICDVSCEFKATEIS